MIFSKPALGTSASAFAAFAPSLLASNALPGTMPSLASFATIGASALAGGLSFISVASS